MDTSATVPTCFIGCDVGKAEIVVFDSRTERITRVRNTGTALTAARRHRDLNAFYRRLLANGRKLIVATAAVMRKLIANARFRDAAIF